MNTLWSAVMFLLVLAFYAIAIAALPLATFVLLRRRHANWFEDVDCQNSACGHPSGDHQMETEDGACWHVGCPCRALERKDHSWTP